MHSYGITTRAMGVLAALAVPASAFFKVPCTDPLVVERADPVVSPGKVSGHSHTIMGGSGFGFNMNYAQARASGCSTCKAKGDSSNYWVPNLYFQASNGSFISVKQNGGMLIYYQQRTEPGSDESSLVPFPEEFRMVAGDPMKRSDSGDNAAKAVSFACLDYNGPATKETNFMPTRNCPSGLRVQVYFPSCWNGVDADSPDHKSHMSYPSNYNGGTCPPGFPKRVISLFYEVIWNTNDFKDMWDGRQQPFVLSNGDPTGYGYHGDFINGWDIPTLTDAIHNCRDNNGDIKQCAPLLPLKTDQETNGCKIPASIDEQIFGILPKLPGCNPVTSGPGAATPQTGCGAATAIGQPQQFFTDLTASKKWAYVGCGTDVAFKDRTLSGPNTANDQMTVENCIDYCVGQGTTYAGLEYGRECYCGNDVPADRAPTKGLAGNCMKPCAGNDKEYCGGGQTISLYKKCDGGDCKNAELSVAGGQPLAEGSPAPVGGAPATGGSSAPASGGSSAPAPYPAPAGSSSAPAAPPSSGSGSGTAPKPSSGSPPTGGSGSGTAPKPSSGSDSAPPRKDGAGGTQGYPAPSSTPSKSDAPSGTDTSVPEGASAIPSTDSTPGAASSSDTPQTYDTPTNSTSYVPLPSGWRAVGCHVDPVRPIRALKYWGWWGEPMTSSGCAKHCDSKGYSFAGTENEGQCFCGNKIEGGKEADPAECKMKCLGNAKEVCGGSARLSLFTKVKKDAGGKKTKRARAVMHRHLRAHKAEY